MKEEKFLTSFDGIVVGDRLRLAVEKNTNRPSALIEIIKIRTEYNEALVRNILTGNKFTVEASELYED